MEPYIFELRFKVRDYECDMQGIVNNSVYQNYFEHTRHEYMASRGVNFADLFPKGIVPVVARITIDFKNSLRSGDTFTSRLYVKKDGVKFTFYQALYRDSDDKLCIKAKVDTVCVINGRLTKGEYFDELFQDDLNKIEA